MRQQVLVVWSKAGLALLASLTTTLLPSLYCLPYSRRCPANQWRLEPHSRWDLMKYRWAVDSQPPLPYKCSISAAVHRYRRQTNLCSPWRPWLKWSDHNVRMWHQTCDWVEYKNDGQCHQCHTLSPLSSHSLHSVVRLSLYSLTAIFARFPYLIYFFDSMILIMKCNFSFR